MINLLNEKLSESQLAACQFALLSAAVWSWFDLYAQNPGYATENVVELIEDEVGKGDPFTVALALALNKLSHDEELTLVSMVTVTHLESAYDGSEQAKRLFLKYFERPIKAYLIALAKSGQERPQPGTLLGDALDAYTIEVAA
jgi:hypothetical protein